MPFRDRAVSVATSTYGLLSTGIHRMQIVRGNWARRPMVRKMRRWHLIRRYESICLIPRTRSSAGCSRKDPRLFRISQLKDGGAGITLCARGRGTTPGERFLRKVDPGGVYEELETASHLPCTLDARQQPPSAEAINVRQCALGELYWLAGGSRPEIRARLSRISPRAH